MIYMKFTPFEEVMGGERGFALLVKVAPIPEEGEEGRWEIPPEAFKSGADEVHPLPVKGNAVLSGRIYKDDKTVFFNGAVTATLDLSCSRCLKQFEMDIKEDVTAVFMPRAVMSSVVDEVEVTQEDLDVQLYDEEELDLFGPAHDQVALALPMRPLCDESCKGLCPRCGNDLNEGLCGCSEPVGDSRFAALKKLKF
ncbi:MAG: DUF177 domain-containing protein [Nitrospinae bacterium]|nr:DUF177 domain-containing protein [Nitrospinota bacterium]MBF0635462.1 DUF177 domain-containing protein [Nitrospinota bacterium]